MKAGDILVAYTLDENDEDDEIKYAVGIYGGNDVYVITSKETGCTTINLRFYKVKGAYRWPLLYQLLPKL